MKTSLRFFPADNPIFKVNHSVLQRILDAQENAFDACFQTAHDLVSRVLNDMSLTVKSLPNLMGVSAVSLADTPHARLVDFFASLLRRNAIPDHAISSIAGSLASRTHLLRAFASPEAAIGAIKTKVMAIIDTFPKSGQDIEVGRNKGDVLDPFILAASQYLLHVGSFDDAIGSTVSHKALMIIEGLLGHLHEDVIGMMRGNVRVPEPRGRDQERFDYAANPFPGADVLQPPLFEGDTIKFHQIKSKTGSAKGGDGKRLGEQLRWLQTHYGGEIYYHALIGNTLSGHRSKKGVEKVAPTVIVLVGDASFRVLTRSTVGAQLLLRLYTEAFLAAAQEKAYSIESITDIIAEYFREQAEQYGEGYLETILAKATEGPAEEQDSRLFNGKRASDGSLHDSED